FSRKRVLADRTQFITPLCLPQEDINEYAHQDCQQKCKVERNVLRNKGEILIELRNISGRADRRRLHNWVPRYLEVVLGKIADQCDTDKVEHDRIDHLVRSKPRAQDTWN